METYLIPILSMGGLGALLASILVLADSKLRVKEDPNIDLVEEELPGANCGACGYPGCRQFAEQVVAGNLDPTECRPSSPEAIQAIAGILGIEVEVGVHLKARIMCLGGKAESETRSEYAGVEDCRAAALVGGGNKGCVYGCLGFGSCVESCPFGAMRMDANGLPEINDDLCTGCGICTEACPKKIIDLVREGEKVLLGCSSPEKAKAVKEVCSRGCIGCSLCAKVCPVDAIVMDGNLPVIDQEKCTACGDCIDRCPTDSLLEPQINHILLIKRKKKAV